jgi:hypothetical protein
MELDGSSADRFNAGTARGSTKFRNLFGSKFFRSGFWNLPLMNFRRLTANDPSFADCINLVGSV